MGLFSKIKGILFEDDEDGEIPVYTKEDTSKKEKIEEQVKVQATPNVEVHSEPSEVRFRPPRAEMEYKDDILDEVAKKDDFEMPKPAKEPDVVKEEKPSPFLSFDEEEFERLNSHVVVNDRPTKPVSDMAIRREEYSDFQRKANSNFSATTPSRDNNKRNPDRYKIDDSNTKRPFKPSPVISPVYGILDKNYKVDDIVDKKDGVKREVVKVPVREEITAYRNIEEDNEPQEEVISIDSVRNKAFGAMDELEKTATLTIEEKSEERKQVIEIPIMAEAKEDKNDNKSNDLVEDFNLIDDDEEVENVNLEDDTNASLDDLVSQHFDNVETEEELEDEVENAPRALDDVEKTTTLQILDDIEKELNSIKPITEKEEDSEEETEKKDESLENDLFNLIDSMYEKGDDEDDD